MTEATGADRVADIAASRAWSEVYSRLHDTDPTTLSPEDLDALAEAAWWLRHTEEALALKQHAYIELAERGQERWAAMTAWWLFYGHLYWGQRSQANGWLRRMQRHLESHPESLESAYLAFAEAETALHQERLEHARHKASIAVQLGQRYDHPDPVAMGLQIQGRALSKLGERHKGFELLDEAMTFAVSGQISDLLTGSVYCSVIHTCRDFGDLERAVEWTAAMQAWYEALPAVTPYHGLCRVYRGEVLGLCGMWTEAEAELRTASDTLKEIRPRAAAEALYDLGELSLRRGNLADADSAFTQAQKLGRDPQPGRTFLLLAQGRPDAAHASIAASLARPPADVFQHARLLAAQVEAELAVRDLPSARRTADTLAELAAQSDNPALRATAALAAGSFHTAAGNAEAGVSSLRQAGAIWSELALPYEEAQARRLLGTALRLLEDEAGGQAELQAARATFSELGASLDVALIDAELGKRPAGLTAREIEVLRLVASGATNREIADSLFISEHTVRRHIQNIFAKIGVSSRTAASAYAYRHHLA